MFYVGCSREANRDFASTAPGNLLTPDEQRHKLELVVETARQVWG